MERECVREGGRKEGKAKIEGERKRGFRSTKDSARENHLVYPSIGR